MSKNKKLNIGIIGCGAIGSELGLFVDRKLKPKVNLAGICDINQEAVQALQKKLKAKPKALSLEDLIGKVDLVIEAAGQDCARDVLKAVAKFKKKAVILSVGALIRYPGAFKKAKSAGVDIYIPSGAVCGIDGLGALSLSKEKQISLITSKPPAGLKGADYLKKKKISLNNLEKEKVVFKGSIKDAVKHFPKNINVAATIFLSSQVKKMQVIIKANPWLKRNVHQVVAVAKEANIKVEVENFPSPANPKTSYLTVLSVENLLKKIVSNLKIGS